MPLTVFLYFWNSFHLERKVKKASKTIKRYTDETEQNSPEKDGLACKFDFRILVPMNPFAKNNRFLTCIIYAAYIHNITKIFFEFSPPGNQLFGK